MLSNYSYYSYSYLYVVKYIKKIIKVAIISYIGAKCNLGEVKLKTILASSLPH